MAKLFGNPINSAMRGFEFVENMEAREREQEWMQEKRQRQRSRWERADEKRRLQDAAQTIKGLAMQEDGTFDLSSINLGMLERRGMQDTVRELAKQSTGRDDIAEVKLRENESKHPALKGQTVPMFRTEGSKEWRPLTDGDGEDAEVLALNNDNLPGVLTAVAARGDPQFFNQLAQQRQAEAAREGQADLTESVLGGMRAKTVDEEKIERAESEAAASEDLAGVQLPSARLDAEIGQKVDGLNFLGRNNESAASTSSGGQESADLSAAAAERIKEAPTFEDKVKLAAAEGVPRDYIINGAKLSRQQRQTVDQAYAEAEAESQPAPENPATSSDSPEALPDSELTGQELREELDDTDEEINATRTALHRLEEQKGSSGVAGMTGRTKGQGIAGAVRTDERKEKDAEIEERQAELQSKLARLEKRKETLEKGFDKRTGMQTSAGGFGGGQRQNPAAGPQTDTASSAAAGGPSLPETTVGPRTEADAQALQQQRAKEARTLRAQAAKAKRVNKNAQRQNKIIDGLVEGVRSGAISDPASAIEMMKTMQENENTEIVRDGNNAALVDTSSNEVLRRFTVDGEQGSSTGTGVFAGEGAPDSGGKKEFAVVRDVAESLAPDNERGQSRYVNAMTQLNDLGVRASPSQWHTLLADGNASINRDDGILDFTGKDPDEITAADVTKSVMANMAGYESLEAFNDGLQGDINNALNSAGINADPSKTVANASSIAGMLMRGQGAMNPEQARNAVAVAAQNPSVVNQIINSPTLSVGQKAERIRQIGQQ